MSSSEKDSKILLLCIKDYNETDVLSSRLELRLYDLFERFGNVKKIIVFCRKILIKSFIEFETIESAVLTRETCHKAFFETLGRVHLYFSTSQQIEIYKTRLDKIKLPDNDQQRHQVTTFKKSNQLPGKISYDFDSSINTRNDFPMEFPPSNVRQERSTNSNNENIDELNESPSLKNEEIQETQCQTHPTEALNTMNSQRVLLISNLDDIWLNVYCLFNLFSCFGNIAKILLLTVQKKALIEFKKQVNIKSLLTLVTPSLFENLKVKLCISKYRRLSLSKDQNTQSNIPNQVYIVPKFKHRFPIDSPFSSQPSRTVSFKSHARIERTDLIQRIYSIISEIQRPLSVKNQKESNLFGGAPFSVRFQFAKVSSAVRVISIMHSRNIDGVIFEVSFEADQE